jgi:FHS family L-fucose permease-like MFS transporter
LAFLIVAILVSCDLPENQRKVWEVDEAAVSRKISLAISSIGLGMIAIFLYMLVLKFLLTIYSPIWNNIWILTQDVAPYISLYWASLMIGRWTGAVGIY